MPNAFASDRLTRLGVLWLLLALLAGCSNNPNPKPWQATRADGTPWQVRYTAMPDEPRSLDPQFAYEETSHLVLEPIYEAPLQYHPMKTAPYELEPCLLEEMPRKIELPGGAVDYLCRFKPGILFQDDPCFTGGKGREMVATDFYYSLQRICDPSEECPIFAALADYVVGFNEAYADGKKRGGHLDYTRPIAGFEAIDRYSFKLHLSKPYPQILYWMALWFMSPVAHEAVDYYDGQIHPGEERSRPEFKWHPVGQGPFSLVEYTPGQRVRLVRNPNYHATVFPRGGWAPESEALLRPWAGHSLPLVDEVQLTIFREALPIWLLTRQGYLDGMGVGKDAYNSVITPVKELSAKYRARGMKLEKDVEPSTFFFVINVKDPLLGGNKKLRQALSCSFDRQGYIDIFANGVPTIAEQLLPPGVPGFRPGYRNPYGFDLEKGRRLLAEAGYPDGIDPKTGLKLEITLDVVASGGDERQAAEYEQRQFEQLGLKVRVIENNFPRMMEKQDQGNLQIASGSGWMADYPDAENFFFLFYSKNIPPVGKNSSRYENPEFDRLFEQMATMENSPARERLIGQMNDILNEDCPMVLTFNKADYVLIQDWAPRTQRNMMLEKGFKYAILNEPLREEKQREWNRRPWWPLLVLVAGVAALAAYAIRWNRLRHV